MLYKTLPYLQRAPVRACLQVVGVLSVTVFLFCDRLFKYRPCAAVRWREESAAVRAAALIIRSDSLSLAASQRAAVHLL
jgi:hypothetical protein